MPFRGEACHHPLVDDREAEVAVDEQQRRPGLDRGRDDEGAQPTDGDTLWHDLTKISRMDGPFMERYSRHVFVCTGGFCSPDRRGRELYAMLPALLQREGLLFGPTRVKRGET